MRLGTFPPFSKVNFLIDILASAKSLSTARIALPIVQSVEAMPGILGLHYIPFLTYPNLAALNNTHF